MSKRIAEIAGVPVLEISAADGKITKAVLSRYSRNTGVIVGG